MKVGVVTTQYASNYGALLQTYALQKHINSHMGIESEVINYFPKHYKEYWRLLPKIESFRSFVLLGMTLLRPWNVFRTKKRYMKYREFVKKFIPCSREYYSYDEIMKEKCGYDICICGSDQIWNVTRHEHIDKVWFLDFYGEWSNVKRVSYAPSIADAIPPEKYNILSRVLNEFDAISVRESSDIEQLSKLTEKKVAHVCDPVFLLSKEEWREIEISPKISQPYILCYFLSPDKQAVEVVKKIKQMTGLKVVHLNVNERDKFKSDYDIRTACSREFLGYIDDAEYVITNSFHCTAFSVLFEKKFVVVKKKTANSRMESLLSKLGLNYRFIDESKLEKITENDLEVDYSSASKIVQGFVNESKEYLYCNLKEKEND